MFLEALEPRQMMTLYPLEPAIQPYFTSNYYPPQQTQVSATDAFLSAPSTADKATIGLNYLKSNAAAFGTTINDLNHVRVTNQHTGTNGITHVYLQQMFNGLPIANAKASIHIAPSGQVISADANFVSGLVHPTVNQRPTPTMSAASALSNFAFMAGIPLLHPVLVNSSESGYNRHTVLTSPDLSDLPIPMEMQYVPKAGGGLELAWTLNVRLPNGKHWYDASIGADSTSSSLRIIQLADWIDYATYNVFAQPVTNPLDGPRTIVTDPHDPEASPFGWHDTNGIAGPEFTDTRGNNVSAQEDRDNNNTGGFRPDGTATLGFDFPLDLTVAPINYESAAITNLFYWNNIVHDVSFHHGFDEVSGNFQVTNYSGLGLGGDAVQADAQDGSGVNNANFGTPPDGIAPRMQQFLFNLTTPNRDSDLMGDIIAHEFGHGISNRLTGGPADASALQCLQSGGMGEGWSDWFGLTLDLKPGEDRDTPQPIGNWVLGQPANGPGIRAFPYSYDMSINPLTLDDYNANQQVHFAGTIWSSALWDLTWLMIGKHGFNPNLYEDVGGQQVAMKLIFEGMKLQPANPTFLDARDAILAADLALYGGDNYDEIWDAFARRGFGLSASIGANCDSTVVVAANDRPPPLARVRGTVFHDINSNKRLDASDLPLEGWTVYVDANNNSTLDVGEKTAVSGIDGTYQLTFFGTGQVTIREVVMPDWFQTFPQTNNGGQVVKIPGRGQIATGVNFGNQEVPGEIHGLKYNDLNANGVRDLDDPLTVGIDETEPGIAGVVIYVDLNDNNSIGILEPAAITDRFGNYTIKNVQPGTYTVREVLTPGMVLTDPSPLMPTNGEHSNVIVTRNAITPDINFGNTEAYDWGDAPTAALSGFAQSYPTTAAQNGARHGILPGFGLGVAGAAGIVVDGEPDGRPTNFNSTGDDIFPAAGPDDENGIEILSLNPDPGVGGGGTIRVSVSNGGFAAGYLQGWFDWNRDGDWNDPGEHAIQDILVRESSNPTIINFDVPDVALGITYARFRYGYERGAAASPTGPAVAGEVEDYLVNVLENTPRAVDDRYGYPGFLPVIRVNQPNNIISYPLIDGAGLSVLGNDATTVDALGNPRPISFPAGFLVTPPTKGTVTLAPAGTLDAAGRRVLVYTPDPGRRGADFFEYVFTDGVSTSNPGRVDIFITSANPVTVDDFVQIAQNAPLAPLDPIDLRFDDLLDNDVWDAPQSTGAFIKSITRITPNPPVGETANLVGLGSTPRTFNFRPATGFTGTVIYEYVLDDGIPLTADVTGRVTIQVGATPSVDPNTSHLASLDVQIVGLDGGAPNLHPGDEFWVQVTAEDLAPIMGEVPPGSPLRLQRFANRTEQGVLAAFIDLLYDESVAAPVSSSANPLDFYIIFPGGTQQEQGTVVSGGATPNTENAFSATGISPFLNYVGNNVRFTSGPLQGQQARITAFNSTTMRFTLDSGSTGDTSAFTQPPSINDVFVIEQGLYDTQRIGELNFPFAGQVDEVGAFYSGGAQLGDTPRTVFMIRFQVNPDLVIAPGSPIAFQVIGDPADGTSPDTEIILTNRPDFANPNVPLTDEEVFIGSATVQVKNPLDGEFSNPRNVLDVNDDDFISAADALTIIDDLNANGSRQLSQANIALTGTVPSGYLDVNTDSYVAAADALMVIDHLNFTGGGPATQQEFVPGDLGGSGSFAAPAGEGEQGEGESAGLVLAMTAEGGSQASALPVSSSNSDPLHEQQGAPSTAVQTPVVNATDSDEEDFELWDEASSDAADEVFGELGRLLE